MHYYCINVDMVQCLRFLPTITTGLSSTTLMTCGLDSLTTTVSDLARAIASFLALLLAALALINSALAFLFSMRCSDAIFAKGSVA